MTSDIKLNGEQVVVEGQAEVQGDASVRGSVSVTGPDGGFIFADRNLKKWSVSPGSHFVWYNSGRVARLWTEGKGDVLTIDADSKLTINDLFVKGRLISNSLAPYGGVVISNGTIQVSNRGTKHGEEYETYDLIQLVEQLRSEVAQLKAKVAELEKK